MTYYYEKYLDRYHRQRLYDIALILQLVGLIIGLSVYKQYPVVMKMISLGKALSLGLVVFKLLIDYWERLFTKKQIVLLMVLTAFIFGLALKNDGQHIAFIWLFLVGSHDVDYKRIIKISFWVHVFCMLFIWISCECGIIDNILLSRLPGEATGEEIKRYGLGFSFVNAMSNMLFYTVLMQIVLRKNKMTLLEIALDGGIAYYLFKQTDTKSAFAFTLLALGVVFIIKYFSKWQSVAYPLRIFLYLLVPVCTFAVGWISIKMNIDGGILAKLNKLVTGRLVLTRAAYRQYGIHLFGQKIQWIGFFEVDQGKGTYNYVDSAYMQQLYSMGIVFMILVVTFMVLLYRKAVQKKDVYLVIGLVIMTMHATFDPQFFMLAYNIFLLAYGYLFNKEWRYSDEFTFQKTEGV